MAQSAPDLATDVSKPAILNAYTDLLLHSLGMEDRRNRFVVGVTGGVAYRLFQLEHIKLTVKDFLRGSLDELALLQRYSSQIEKYLANARSLAPNAELVGIRGRNTHAKDLSLGLQIGAPGSCLMQDLGLGRQSIENVAKLQEYLSSLNEGLPLLDQEHAKIMETLGRIYAQ